MLLHSHLSMYIEVTSDIAFWIFARLCIFVYHCYIEVTDEGEYCSFDNSIALRDIAVNFV